MDFSTGSVGLGVAITAFASLIQDYLIAHGEIDEADAGRMIALMGDADLDEGDIYECLIEAYKHDIRNCWLWIGAENGTPVVPRQAIESASKPYITGGPIGADRDPLITHTFKGLQVVAPLRPGSRFRRRSTSS
ncbi:hypothetical protein ACVWYO_003179 [Sphingomonas sp. UYP23]